MKTKTISIYTFDELSDKAKDHAREYWREHGMDYDWYEFTLDLLREKLEKAGFISPEIRFSGFCSQGDGASFTASIDLIRWLKANKSASNYRPILKAIRDGRITGKVTPIPSHYVHENTAETALDHEGDLTTKQCALMDRLQQEIEEDRRLLSNRIYRDLEKEYEYLTANGQIDENIRNNGYEFNADGSMA